MAETLVEFRNLTFQYDAQAEPTLFDINLTIRAGEKVLIVGPSGSGKSTLAHLINGLIPFSYSGTITGNILVGGAETRETSLFQLSKTVGTVLQDTDGQFIGLTVAEDIAFQLENDMVGQSEMISRAQRVAETVGVSGKLEAAPHALSGGQKQRVSMAGVLVGDVKLLLLDEPLASLDPATGKDAIALVDQINRDTGCAVVIIEHRLEDALYRPVDRIVLMWEGRIVADTTPDRLLATDLLVRHGIREPLYVTAMRYMDIAIREDMRLSSIDTLTLTDAEKARVRAWFEKNEETPDSDAAQDLLTVERLAHAYHDGTWHMQDITFAVGKGAMTAIVGRNGAGKSTLAKLICGFETPRSGTIALNGRDLAGDTIKERARHIGYVMQNPNQMISKTMIFDEVAMALRQRGMSEEKVRSRVEETLRICGLYEMRAWPISALSYGQKKRVTIACVLVSEPDVIILDEPTAGQDFRHYTEIMEFLLTLNRAGVTVLMITHDMHLMLEYTNQALVFSEGRLIADAKSARVLTDLELVERASLKRTSLYDLANMCELPPEAFVERFIRVDRQVRGHG